MDLIRLKFCLDACLRGCVPGMDKIFKQSNVLQVIKRMWREREHNKAGVKSKHLKSVRL